MEDIKVYQFGKLLTTLACFRPQVKIKTWAEAMNYIETNGYHHDTEIVYFNSAEDAYIDYVHGFGNAPVDYTFSEFKKIIKPDTVADMCRGRIEFVEHKE